MIKILFIFILFFSINITFGSFGSCDIKGNISFDTGEKIYHIPGCTDYDATVINTNYGEKWFCSEQEAINSGWRKAYNCSSNKCSQIKIKSIEDEIKSLEWYKNKFEKEYNSAVGFELQLFYTDLVSKYSSKIINSNLSLIKEKILCSNKKIDKLKINIDKKNKIELSKNKLLKGKLSKNECLKYGFLYSLNENRCLLLMDDIPGVGKIDYNEYSITYCSTSYGKNSVSMYYNNMFSCDCKKGYNFIFNKSNNNNIFYKGECIQQKTDKELGTELCKNSFGQFSLSDGTKTNNGGYNCQCEAGYIFNNDNTSCIQQKTDKELGTELCKNSFGQFSLSDGTKSNDGSYNCQCKTGYTFDNDNKSCIKIIEKKVIKVDLNDKIKNKIDALFLKLDKKLNKLGTEVKNKKYLYISAKIDDILMKTKKKSEKDILNYLKYLINTKLDDEG